MEIPILFGRFLVREGLITEKALIDALSVQAEINRSFAAVALERNFITLDDFKTALNYQRQHGITFRDSLLDLEIADEKTLSRIDEAVENTQMKLGELLIRKGAISREQLEASLTAFNQSGVMELT